MKKRYEYSTEWFDKKSCVPAYKADDFVKHLRFATPADIFLRHHYFVEYDINMGSDPDYERMYQMYRKLHPINHNKILAKYLSNKDWKIEDYRFMNPISQEANDRLATFAKGIGYGIYYNRRFYENAVIRMLFDMIKPDGFTMEQELEYWKLTHTTMDMMVHGMKSLTKSYGVLIDKEMKDIKNPDVAGLIEEGYEYAKGMIIVMDYHNDHFDTPVRPFGFVKFAIVFERGGERRVLTYDLEGLRDMRIHDFLKEAVNFKGFDKSYKMTIHALSFEDVMNAIKADRKIDVKGIEHTVAFDLKLDALQTIWLPLDKGKDIFIDSLSQPYGEGLTYFLKESEKRGLDVSSEAINLYQKFVGMLKECMCKLLGCSKSEYEYIVNEKRFFDKSFDLLELAYEMTQKVCIEGMGFEASAAYKRLTEETKKCQSSGGRVINKTPELIPIDVLDAAKTAYAEVDKIWQQPEYKDGEVHMKENPLLVNRGLRLI